jgi:thioredoxin 1
MSDEDASRLFVEYHEELVFADIRARFTEELERKAPGAAAKPHTVTDATFDAFVKSHKTVVVDAWAPWCPPCRVMGPIIDELAGRWAGKIAFGKLNTDENQDTAMRFGIFSIPTLLIFRDGEFHDQIVGLPPKPRLVEMLAPLAQ